MSHSYTCCSCSATHLPTAADVWAMASLGVAMHEGKVIVPRLTQLVLFLPHGGSGYHNPGP